MSDRVPGLSARSRALAVIACFALVGVARAEPPAAPEQASPFPEASVLAIQPYQQTATAAVAGSTRLWLVDLNRNVHEWFLLARRTGERGAVAIVHVENPLGLAQRVSLGDDGLAVEHGGTRTRCALATGDGRDLFARPTQPFTPFCGGHLLLRSQMSGYQTTEEFAVSVLRSMGGVGEAIINLYKTTIGADANLERAQVERRAEPEPGRAGQPAASAELRIPRAANVDPSDAASVFVGHRLGIRLAAPAGGAAPRPRPGQWYATALQQGAYVSIIAPHQVEHGLLQRDLDRANPLDNVETNALVYLLAFDLETYAISFHVGTDHPAVDWSPRPQVAHGGHAGPDGFGSLRPLARVGMVSPQERPRLAGIFVGGFKREHAAFRYGPLSQINQGTHYGFIERGVVLSRLQPGLSTLFGRLDGSVEMRTWTAADTGELPHLAFARQNGVPLVELDAATRRPVPGSNVRSWGLGNWSGALVIRTDPEGNQVRGAELRSVRAGACIQENAGRRFLIYGYFSAATPSGMARVFQAYGCSHAMLLDMNSPELTYATLVGATQGGQDERLVVEYLNQAMAGAEPGARQFRFLTANDNRDYFVVLRRPGAAPR